METLKDFILDNSILEYGDLIASVTIGLCFFIAFDFMHLLFNAVLSWFKRY